MEKSSSALGAVAAIGGSFLLQRSISKELAKAGIVRGIWEILFPIIGYLMVVTLVIAWGSALNNYEHAHTSRNDCLKAVSETYCDVLWP